MTSDVHGEPTRSRDGTALVAPFSLDAIGHAPCARHACVASSATGACRRARDVRD
jgi:hypothetical protein